MLQSEKNGPIDFGLKENSGGISFESVSSPGYFMTQSKFRVVVAKKKNTASYKDEATWKFIIAQYSVETHVTTHYVTKHHYRKCLVLMLYRRNL